MSERQPILLDLFCGAGGSAVGYHRAGWDVIGVDIEPQPHYPFRFVRCDAIEFLWREMMPFASFDAIHASPPCQKYSTLSGFMSDEQFAKLDDLVDLTRELLAQTKLPYIIENVPGAPLRTPLTLCGSMFGLGAMCRDGVYRQLRRHRLFESNVLLMSPGPCKHEGYTLGVYGKGSWNHNEDAKGDRGGYQGSVAEKYEAMGIDWMSGPKVTQAVPPAYTQYLGEQLLQAVRFATTTL